MKTTFWLWCVAWAALGGGGAAAQPQKAAAAKAAAAALLRSGPMVGYSEAREVALWVQTTGPATAQIAYWEPARPQVQWRTAPVAATAAHGYAVHLLADQVQPGRRYAYALYLNGQRVARPYPLEFQSQMLWLGREEPRDFRFALGSCTYINEATYDPPGWHYGGDYDIFTSIDAQHPDFMLWLGDNNYLREADWNTRTGIYHRNAHSRALPEMQPLLARSHNYAIWDDHDYGPNDSNRSYANKALTLAAFKDFWANQNYASTEGKGIYGTFQWNDVQFFMLDNRWFRAPDYANSKEGDYLGPEQLTWLLDALASSTATFKLVVVGGQVLNPAKVFETYSNYEREQAELLRGIASRKVPGVVFLTGDRHFSELTKTERPGTYPLYDFTCSPLTSSPALTGPQTEPNTGRVAGTLAMQRNFGIISVTGPLAARQLTLTVRDHAGKLLWEHTLPASSLR